MSSAAVTIPQAFAMALEQFQLGHVDEAEAISRQIIAAHSEHPGAAHLLGLIAGRAGQHADAARWIARAVAILPEICEYRLDLAEALQGSGEYSASVDEWRAALRLHPQLPDAHYGLGVALGFLGLLEEAVEAYRGAVRLRPDHVRAWSNLGVALHHLECPQEAIAAFQAGLKADPGAAALSINLGNVLQDAGELDAAIAAYRASLAQQPDLAVAHYNLGNLLKRQGRLVEAAAAYHAAIRSQPGNADALHNLSSILREEGKIEEAISTARAAVAMDPQNSLRQSNLLYTLQFHPGLTEEEIAGEHALWNEHVSAPLRAARLPHGNDPGRDRRLRVGFVSPDFYQHAVSFFLVPLFEALDRTQVEVCCYSDVRGGDATTERLRKAADRWCDSRRLSATGLAERIRRDAIDILIDLTMHTRSNRLETFAHKPAPVQVSWLAYPGSTGLETMDYRLTDAFLEPPGVEARAVGERPWRLPDSWCCYEPHPDFPEIGPLPSARAGHVTFGSINKFARVNDAVLGGWALLLTEVPDSHLLLLCPDGDCRDRVGRFFAERGVAGARLEWVEFLPWDQYVQLFGRIDLALDPFPGNGMTTTLHSLWMGVPVVLLAGETPLARAGESLLSTAGLPELVATSVDEYVQIAAALARDRARLESLRATLRGRLRESPLLDAPRFARNLEVAFRGMWRRWCEQK